MNGIVPIPLIQNYPVDFGGSHETQILFSARFRCSQLAHRHIFRVDHGIESGGGGESGRLNPPGVAEASSSLPEGF